MLTAAPEDTRVLVHKLKDMERRVSPTSRLLMRPFCSCPFRASCARWWRVIEDYLRFCTYGAIYHASCSVHAHFYRGRTGLGTTRDNQGVLDCCRHEGVPSIYSNTTAATVLSMPHVYTCYWRVWCTNPRLWSPCNTYIATTFQVRRKRGQRWAPCWVGRERGGGCQTFWKRLNLVLID